MTSREAGAGATVRERVGALVAASWLLWAAHAGTVGADPSGKLPDVGAGPATAARRVRQAWIDHALRSANPRLDGWTRGRITRSVLRCEQDQGLDPDLVLAVLLVESSARPDARSPKGAVGLMQVMPHMFRALDLPGGVAHLEANVEAGCILLADNIRRLGEAEGISAYFWGSSIGGDDYLKRVRSMRALLARAPRLGSASEG